MPNSQLKVRLTRRWPEEVERAFADRFDVTLNADDRPLTADELREAMQAFDVVCPTVTDRIDAGVLEAANRTPRLLANYGAGVDHIDLDAARRVGLQASNTPDVLTDATADIALTLILMASRRAGEGERELRAGRWSGWRPTHLLGTALAGKTLGILGFGRIGQAVAARATAFGLRIAYHSRTRKPAEIEAKHGARYCATLEELLKTSDILSVHTSGGAASRHLIDKLALSSMKPSAILVNTARGSVVNEADLADALASGRIAYAGLDVFEREPQIHPKLLEAQNVVLLPHLGSATRETRIAMGMRVLANIEAWIETGEVIDRVA
jgi:lactate dehydrogenase-like 2-hydroxyacid dehydrogenase